MKAWPILGIGLMQTIPVAGPLVHFSHPGRLPRQSHPSRISGARDSALPAGLQLHRRRPARLPFTNFAVTLIYSSPPSGSASSTTSFCAACLCWLANLALLSFPLRPVPASIPSPSGRRLLRPALLAGIYGLLNARWIRIRRVTVQLPNLPASWRGRTALLISDLHLGNVNGPGFCRRIVAWPPPDPDIVFFPATSSTASMTDPTASSLPSRRSPRPSASTSPPATTMSMATPPTTHRSQPRRHPRSGQRVVFVDGLDLLGVPYGDSIFPPSARHLKACTWTPPNPASCSTIRPPPAHRRASRHQPPALRPHPRRTALSLHLVYPPRLRQVHLRSAPLRLAPGVHLQRRRNLGPSHARRHPPRNRPAPFRFRHSVLQCSNIPTRRRAMAITTFSSREFNQDAAERRAPPRMALCLSLIAAAPPCTVVDRGIPKNQGQRKEHPGFVGHARCWRHRLRVRRAWAMS